MPTEQEGQENSDMWISLDEAMLRSGKTKKEIIDWTKSGEVKREKKKGIIYVWVADLIKLTPLTQTELPPKVKETTEIIRPESSVASSMAHLAPLRNIAEQMEQSLEQQRHVLEKIDALEIQINQPVEIEKQPPLLDEKTIKELSLLGNVFKSIYQQHEKISKSLEDQEKVMNQLALSERESEVLKDKINKAEKGKMLSHFTWAIVCLVIVCVIGVALFVSLQDKQNIITNFESYKSENVEKVRGLQQEKKETVARLENVIDQTKNEHKVEIEKMSSIHQQDKKDLKHDFDQKFNILKQTHENEVNRMNMANRDSIEKLNEKHRQEIKRLEVLNEQHRREMSVVQDEGKKTQSEQLKKTTLLEEQIKYQIELLKQLKMEMLKPPELILTTEP